MKRGNSYLKLFTLEFLIAGSVCLSAILLFTYVADEVVIEKEDLFDARTFDMMRSLTSSFNTNLALIITFFGSGYFLIPVYLVIIIFFIKSNKRHYSILVAVIAIISLVSGWALKEIFHRSRPPLPLVPGAGGYSFPSGHSLGGFTFCGVIIYLICHSKASLLNKWLLSILSFLFGLLIGLSRIYLHVHFASDVLGSFFITIVWLSLSFIFFRVFQKRLPDK